MRKWVGIILEDILYKSLIMYKYIIKHARVTSDDYVIINMEGVLL